MFAVVLCAKLCWLTALSGEHYPPRAYAAAAGVSLLPLLQWPPVVLLCKDDNVI